MSRAEISGNAWFAREAREIAASVASATVVAPVSSVAGHQGRQDFSATIHRAQHEIRNEIHRAVTKGFGTPSQLSLSPAAQAHWAALGVGSGVNLSRSTLATAQRSQHTSISSAGADMASLGPSARTFLADIAPWAKQAAASLGVAPHLVAAHAALESGWGKRPLLDAEGRSTHNLFGLKAGSRWRGAVARAKTTEYIEGTRTPAVEPFRAYPDLRSAFEDYAKLLLDNPRFSAARHKGHDAVGFSKALARAGYATDPRYAEKLAAVAASLSTWRPEQPLAKVAVAKN